MTSTWTRTKQAISRVRLAGRAGPHPKLAFAYERLLRAELFNADQMASHGIDLATRHQLGAVNTRDFLLGRLDDNEALLKQSCSALTEAQASDRRITPAAEWLLDNFS